MAGWCCFSASPELLAGILPEVYAKSLLYRSPQLTNVFVQAYYGLYNYSELGLK
jgi:peptide/nickel transport system substrate-binding protein